MSCVGFFFLVKIPLSDQILDNLCGMLSLPWICSHPDDSFKTSAFGIDPLALSEKTAQSFCKYIKVYKTYYLSGNYFSCPFMINNNIQILNQVITCFIFLFSTPNSVTLCVPPVSLPKKHMFGLEKIHLSLGTTKSSWSNSGYLC